jgi:AcrR family transcriptional regulator
MGEDSRVIRTKKAIKKSFITLLGMKDIDSITVKDIAHYANVDRKTVYNYYPGVYALIEEIEEDFAVSMAEHAKFMQSIDILENPDEYVEVIKDEIIKNLVRYKDFLNAQQDSNLLLKLTKIIETNVEANLVACLRKAGIEPAIYNVKLCATFIIDGMIGVCRNCIKRLENDPGRVIKDVITLALYGTSGLVKGIPQKRN